MMEARKMIEDNENKKDEMIDGLSLEQQFQLRLFKEVWEKLPKEILLSHLEMLFVQMMARQNLFGEMMKDKFRGL